MRWLDAPPCSHLDVAHRTETRLELKGPGLTHRVSGGATAAFGGLFASVSARVLRLPIPLPFKLVPLALTAVGVGMTAVGASVALASCQLEVDRREGLTLRWKLVGRDERNVHLARDEVEAFEVTQHTQRVSSDFDDGPIHEYRLVAVAKDGRSLELEAFGTRTQATLRKQEIERLLK